MFNILFIICTILLNFIDCDVCPNPPVKQNFDLIKYTGQWYEILRFKLINENNLKCNKANYTIIDKSTIKVNNTGINAISGKFVEIIGSATVPNTSVPAKLILTFIFGPITATSDYWVLDTDYSTYSVVYDCRITLGTKTEYCWILSRENTLNQSTVDKIKKNLSSYGIDPSKFLLTDQSDCKI